MNPEENNSNKLLFKIGIIIIIVVISFVVKQSSPSFWKSRKTNNQTWQKINADMNKSLDELDEITNKLAAHLQKIILLKVY